MRAGTVARLRRYPVKSMEGEVLSEARLAAGGLVGDRGWAVHHVARAGVTTAKRIAAIRCCRAAYATEPVAGAAPPDADITLPDEPMPDMSAFPPERLAVRIGGVVLEVTDMCPRCVMVTHAVDEVPADPGVMRTLVRETRHMAGVYTRVVKGGVIRVGEAASIDA